MYEIRHTFVSKSKQFDTPIIKIIRETQRRNSDMHEIHTNQRNLYSVFVFFFFGKQTFQLQVNWQFLAAALSIRWDN